MKKNKVKIKYSKEKMKKFLMDSTNKSLICSLLALISLVFVTKLVSNLFLRLAIYFGIYFILNNLYYRFVFHFFGEHFKQ